MFQYTRRRGCHVSERRLASKASAAVERRDPSRSRLRGDQFWSGASGDRRISWFVPQHANLLRLDVRGVSIRGRSGVTAADGERCGAHDQVHVAALDVLVASRHNEMFGGCNEHNKGRRRSDIQSSRSSDPVQARRQGRCIRVRIPLVLVYCIWRISPDGDGRSWSYSIVLVARRAGSHLALQPSDCNLTLSAVF